MTAGRGLDKPLLFVVAALIIPGLATIYSAGQTDFPTVAADIWQRQAVWLLGGIVGAALLFRMSPRVLEWLTPFVYIGAMAVLVLTLFASFLW